MVGAIATPLLVVYDQGLIKKWMFIEIQNDYERKSTTSALAPKVAKTKGWPKKTTSALDRLTHRHREKFALLSSCNDNLSIIISHVDLDSLGAAQRLLHSATLLVLLQLQGQENKSSWDFLDEVRNDMTDAK